MTPEKEIDIQGLHHFPPIHSKPYWPVNDVLLNGKNHKPSNAAFNKQDLDIAALLEKYFPELIEVEHGFLLSPEAMPIWSLLAEVPKAINEKTLSSLLTLSKTSYPYWSCLHFANTLFWQHTNCQPVMFYQAQAGECSVQTSDEGNFCIEWKTNKNGHENEYEADELPAIIEHIKKIPKDISTLHAWTLPTPLMAPQVLNKIFQAIPSHIKTINFRFFLFRYKKSWRQFDFSALKNALPHTELLLIDAQQLSAIKDIDSFIGLFPNLKECISFQLDNGTLTYDKDNKLALNVHMQQNNSRGKSRADHHATLFSTASEEALNAPFQTSGFRL